SSSRSAPFPAQLRCLWRGRSLRTSLIWSAAAVPLLWNAESGSMAAALQNRSDLPPAAFRSPSAEFSPAPPHHAPPQRAEPPRSLAVVNGGHAIMIDKEVTAVFASKHERDVKAILPD